MIEINLLPKELRKKKRKIELPTIPVIPIGAGAIALLVIIQLLLGSVFFIAKAHLARLDKKWDILAPKKRELDKIKRKLNTTKKKIRAIDELMAKRLNWSRVLNELSNSIRSNIWFNELDYRESLDGNIIRGTLSISGSSISHGEEGTADIAYFIRSLKTNEEFFRDFEDVELVNITKGSVSGQDVMNFALICKFKPRTIK